MTQLRTLQFFVSIRGYLLFLLSLLYIEHILLGWTNDAVIVLFTVVTFIVSLPGMSRLPKMLTLVMLGLGHLLFFLYGGSAAQWTSALFQSLPFVALFVAVPLLSIPIRVGGYVELIVSYLAKFANRHLSLHAIVSGSSFLLGSLLNIGAIRIMDDLFGNVFNQNRGQFVKGVTRGFALSAIFSPYIAGVAIVLFLLDVPLLPFLLYSVVIVFFGLLQTVGLTYVEMKFGSKEASAAEPAEPLAAEEAVPNRTRKGWELLLAFVGLFVLIILMERWSDLNLIIMISLIGFTYPIVWTLWIKKQRELPSQFSLYRKNVLPNIHNESVMVVSASFFSNMVQLSPLQDVLAGWMAFVTQFSSVLTVFLIVSIVLALTLIGIHQIIPITIIAGSYAEQSFGLDPLSLAVVLAVAWGMSALTGPISAVTITSSQLFKVTWLQLIRWNWKFVALMVCSVTIIVSLLRLWVPIG